MKQSNVNENTNEKQVKISQAKAEPPKTNDIKNNCPICRKKT